MARPVNSPSPNVVLRLDNDDKQLLKQLCAVEKLTRSDVIRHAVRDYAKKLGVTPVQQDKVA